MRSISFLIFAMTLISTINDRFVSADDDEFTGANFEISITEAEAPPEPLPEPPPSATSSSPPTTGPRNETCRGILYRAYNGLAPDHLYTTSMPEIVNAGRSGWRRESDAATVAFDNNCECGDETKLIPVYRSYNKFTNDHLYTQSADEKNKAGPIGWKYEKIAFYCAAASGQCGATKPLYRYFHLLRDHFYTTSKAEGDNCVKRLLCRAEGVTCFVW